ncbi:cytochrome P450 [Mycobacterium montefiorense]|uniref:Cytochrome P450 n=1 Tax=Mycobacterium montefiorense TaxID=154654 RepID=A0AA37PQP6_9MYCO|nr:cytochrome P450 [Mycobacterium montefiorense]GBG36227.1 putative cytochrome P450 [Mycobacterium montefiorense]GKU33004.1 putative cytochrome P450 [Mycobacterium montefiorense]GKU38526.1 putative cytochrome P450 [Mycobacterium montefiorense]GKU46708.1 putative cytochrome P450 [Mycobacterium montefiorense]GKU51520.1 putative cytochrome P450 [Mycobacterium montefiorense]
MTIPDFQVPERLPWDAADPYSYYELRRRDGDVVWDHGMGAWLILGYHSVQQILGGDGWTSSPLANVNTRDVFRAVDRDMLRSNILFTDDVDHQRLRDSVRDVFTRSFVAGLHEGIEAIATETIDRIPTGVEFDFMTEIASPLPIAVVAAWMGLDVDTARLIGDESPAIGAMISDIADTGAVEAGTAAFATLLAELLPLAADRRRTHRRDDLLGFIAADPNLELEDVVTTAVIILVAGHGTTANLLGAAMIRLLKPGPTGVRLVDTVDTVDDRLVSELLRLDGPVQVVGRTATRDQDVGGVAIHAGEVAYAVIGAANRDPEVFSWPRRLRIDRPGPAPLAFGYGSHYCLGAALARLEIAVALQHILARRPALRGEPKWQETPAIRGPAQLMISFEGA